MKKIFSNKLVLHIPDAAWIDNKLENIDSEIFLETICKKLMGIDVNSWYVTSVTGYYKGRKFDEKLLTVFCGTTVEYAIIDIFEETYKELNDVMHQESFAYELNGILCIVDLY